MLSIKVEDFFYNINPSRIDNHMKISLEHISSNCNPIPGCFDFLTNQMIAYCYKNQVGLYSLTDSKVHRNIHCNRKLNPNRANFLKTFVFQEQYFILVGYDNGSLVTYSSPDTKQWKEGHIIKQKNSILNFTIFNQFLAVLNNDALVSLYERKFTETKQMEWCLVEEIQFPLNKTIQSVALQMIENSLVVFLAGVDHKIHCYSLAITQTQAPKQEIQYLFSLTGHENAITKLAIVEQKGSYFLASCSKDGYIRLWKITNNIEEAKFHKNVKTLLQDYRMFLQSVLISHECSVTNLHWARFNGLQLVSASMDCTVCIWAANQDGSWSVQSRMGQFLGNKNAYFQAISNQSGHQLAALNFIGSVLIWNYSKQQNKFTLRQSFNGHYHRAKDIAWNHTGDYLVSVSQDQTTRVIAQHKTTKNYHEISRAQVHGYDINTLCLLKTKEHSLDLIACGADEKVVRIVEPPACFANYLNTFTGKNLHLYFQSPEEEKKYIQQQGTSQKPLLYQTYTEGGAQVLGLMTKATRIQKQKVVNYFDDEEQEEMILEDEKLNLKDSKKTDFNVPPHDDYLIKHTLWPEMNKLYAHPHEMEYLCRSPDSKLMASSCTGLTKDDSQVIIWDTSDWKVSKILSHHSYTVYCMQFSKSGKYFVSVSKDRKLAVFDSKFEFIFGYEPHTRAITCVSFSADQKYIATGSRDKTIKLHSIADQKIISEFKFDQTVTSVAFCQMEGRQNILCCGLLNGQVLLLSIVENNEFKILGKVSEEHSHTEKVNAIRWNGSKIATCSDDHSVCIFNVEFEGVINE